MKKIKNLHLLQGVLGLASIWFMFSRCTSGGPSRDKDQGAVMPPELEPTPTTEQAPSSLATAPPTAEATPSPSTSPKVYEYPFNHNFARAGDLTDPTTGKAASLKLHIETELARTLRDPNKANVPQDIAPTLAKLLVQSLAANNPKIGEQLNDNTFDSNQYGVQFNITETLQPDRTYVYSLESAVLRDSQASASEIRLENSRTVTPEDVKRLQQEQEKQPQSMTPAEFKLAFALAMQQAQQLGART